MVCLLVKQRKLFCKLENECFKCKNVVLIKHKTDTRYTRKDLVVSHDQMSMVAIPADSLVNDPEGIPEDVNLIGIDEGQFFVGLFDFCKRWNTKGVDIAISACNTLVNRTPFPGSEISDLINWGATIKQCYSTCVCCYSAKATLTKSIKDFEGSVVVEGPSMFVPVCYKCHDVEITEDHIKRRDKNIENANKLFI